MTYVLIGLGGAIGSMLRAWLGILMVALTGPAFPWGTILINVLGSFVIGFFGTLTSTDGRFAVPPDLRAFVMVGVCGGFTTFSSFSLQTLDLLRDGRPGQALGNIALSVLLCLGSVATGYSAALLVRNSGLLALAAAGPDSLGNQTLVALHRPESVEPMLDMAGRLMAQEHTRTTVLAIDGPVLAGLLPTEEVLTKERREEVSKRRQDWVAACRPALDRWVVEQQAKGHRARWIEVRGDGTAAILEHGRGAHLLLLEHRPEDRASLDRVRAALVHASRPVLLVPPGARKDIGHVVAVAWRDDPQAREAVRLAMPILSRAQRVVVLQVGAPATESVALPDVFATLPTDSRTVPGMSGDVGAQLLGMAREAGADLLVMGSYDQGRVREALFDGVTESILRTADIPVFMQPKES